MSETWASSAHMPRVQTAFTEAVWGHGPDQALMWVQAMVHSLLLSGVTSIEKSISIIKYDFPTPPTISVKATCSRMDFVELLFHGDIRQHISFYITECDTKLFYLSHASVWLLIYASVFLVPFQQYYWWVMVWCIKHAMFYVLVIYLFLEPR